MTDKLNKILRWILDRLNGIGMVYTGSLVTASVPNEISSLIAQMTIPAGTYVITGNYSWNVDDRAVLTIISLRSPELICQVRGTMWAGGGDCVTGVKVLDKETTIKLYAYQSSGSTRQIVSLIFNAVRIK